MDPWYKQKQTNIISFFKVSNKNKIIEPANSESDQPLTSTDSTTAGCHENSEDSETLTRRDSELQSENLEKTDYCSEDLTETVKSVIRKAKLKKKKYIHKCREAYTEKFNWLVNKDGQSYCKYCQKYIFGSYTHLLRHGNRIFHKKKTNSIKTTYDMNTFKTKVDEKKVFSTKVKECELKMTMLVIEHNLPMLLMDHLPKLMSSAAPDSEILKNVNCSRTKTTCLLKNFQEESEQNVASILKDRKFSLIVNETTDVTVKKCLAILVRYVHINLEKVRDRLLALVEVKDVTSEGILQQILKIIENLGKPLPNLVGFAADNASVMMGKYNGVQAKLKQINPNIFVMGCICHSLHLCASAAAEKIPKQIEDFVRDIYNYLNCSSKRIVEYREFQEYVQLKPHKLLKPSQTRWLSLEAVVKRTLEQWPALQLFFSAAILEDNLVAASTIHNALSNIIYKLYFVACKYSLL